MAAAKGKNRQRDEKRKGRRKGREIRKGGRYGREIRKGGQRSREIQQGESSLYARTRGLAHKAGMRPSRKLGQSFLVEIAAARSIVETAAAKPGEWILEIGPGLGALTFELAERGLPVVAVEKDLRLVQVLAPLLRGRIQFVAMDARRLGWDTMAARPPVLLSNLPYPITTEILLQLCRTPQPVLRALILVQREVAQRVAAKAGASQRGALSVMVQLVYNVSVELEIGPHLFWPRPSVQSSLLRLEPKASAVEMGRLLRGLVRDGFGQRRKKLANALGIGRRRPAELLEKVGLPANVRAQDLDNEDWIRLAQWLEQGDDPIALPGR